MTYPVGLEFGVSEFTHHQEGGEAFLAILFFDLEFF